MTRHFFKFESRFVKWVTDGRKRCTIRSTRKRLPAVGDTAVLQYWTGRPYASKVATIGERTLEAVTPVTIIAAPGYYAHILIHFDGVPLLGGEAEKLARDDGFQNLDALAAFFRPRLPFTGHFYQWKPTA